MKKLNLKTFKSNTKTVKLKTTQNMVIIYIQPSSVAIQLLVKSQIYDQVNVEELMKYPLSPAPYSLGTADEYMARTDKPKEKQFLTKSVNDTPLPDVENTLLIQDGNTIFQTMVNTPSNFQLISHQILDNIPKIINFVFSTNMYQKNSNKDRERKQRGSSEKLIIEEQLTK